MRTRAFRTNSPHAHAVRDGAEGHQLPEFPPLAVEYAATQSLKPKARTPRRHSARQLEALETSIRTFGFLIPLLVDRDGKILAGEARLKVAAQLGFPSVPIIRVEHMSEAQASAFIIADNRLSELGAWDDQVLAEELQALSRLELNFDLSVIGFETPEIDFRIAGLSTLNPSEDDPADILPSANGPAVTRPGDMWLAGEHRILCGDALDEGAYTTLMAGDKAAVAFCDPPYNVKIAHVSGLGKTQHPEFRMASGEMSGREYIAFLTNMCTRLTAQTFDGAIFYVCLDWRHLGDMLGAADGAHCELLNICVWVKHNAGMGSFYRSQHEFVLVLKNGHAAHNNRVLLGRFGRNRTNVWHYRGANNFGRGEGEGDLLALHPTPKPVAMIADALMDCSERGDVVLDPFLGSGSTLIAAERVERRCVGMEIEPAYVDVAIRRWQSLTGRTARHATSGLRFDELQAEAGDGSR